MRHLLAVNVREAIEPILSLDHLLGRISRLRRGSRRRRRVALLLLLLRVLPILPLLRALLLPLALGILRLSPHVLPLSRSRRRRRREEVQTRRERKMRVRKRRRGQHRPVHGEEASLARVLWRWGIHDGLFKRSGSLLSLIPLDFPVCLPCLSYVVRFARQRGPATTQGALQCVRGREMPHPTDLPHGLFPGDP